MFGHRAEAQGGAVAPDARAGIDAAGDGATGRRNDAGRDEVRRFHHGGAHDGGIGEHGCRVLRLSLGEHDAATAVVHVVLHVLDHIRIALRLVQDAIQLASRRGWRVGDAIVAARRAGGSGAEGVQQARPMAHLVGQRAREQVGRTRTDHHHVAGVVGACDTTG